MWLFENIELSIVIPSCNSQRCPSASAPSSSKLPPSPPSTLPPPSSSSPLSSLLSLLFQISLWNYKKLYTSIHTGWSVKLEATQKKYKKKTRIETITHAKKKHKQTRINEWKWCSKNLSIHFTVKRREKKVIKWNANKIRLVNKQCAAIFALASDGSN